MRFVAAIAALLLATSAAAQVTPSGVVAVSSAANVTTLNGGVGTVAEFRAAGYTGSSPEFINLLYRDFVPNSARGGAIDVAEQYAIGLGGGPADAITLTRGIMAADIAGAAVAVGAAAWAGAQIGAPISKALGHDTLNVGDTRCVATNTGWQCDAGSDPVPGQPCVGYNGTSRGGPSCMQAQDYCVLIASGDASSYYQSGPFSGSFVDGTGDNTYCHEYGGGGYQFASRNIGPPSPQAPQKACPASIDALNPAWSRQAGQAPNSDGKCPTGRYNGATDDQVKQRLIDAGKIVAPLAVDLVKDILTHGQPVPTNAPGPGNVPGPNPTPDLGVLSGPASSPGPGSVTTAPDGTVAAVQQTTNNYTYSNNNVTVTNTTTTTTPAGTTTTTGSAPPPDIKTCGLPSTPACKIDETGTPGYTPPPTGPISAVGDGQAATMAATIGAVVDPGLGWFDAPPLVGCTPFQWPIGDAVIDPCPPMEGMRTVMAYLWALFGAWWCFGVIRKAVTGG